jgi:hypothetical protein
MTAALAVLLFGASPAGAAVAATVIGAGKTTDQDGTVISFTVAVAIDGSGMVSGRIGAQLRLPDGVEALEVRATCTQAVDSITLVGGTVVNATRGNYSHFVLIIEDNGTTGDRIGTVRFTGFAPEFDPCAFIASFVPFITRAPLARGNVTVSGLALAAFVQSGGPPLPGRVVEDEAGVLVRAM